MRPTVYIPLDEIRRHGLRRAGATMAARFIAGRIMMMDRQPEGGSCQPAAGEPELGSALDRAEPRGIAA